jgi:hypothetical protein
MKIIKTLYVDPKIYERFKTTCKSKGRIMGKVFENLMKRYIRENTKETK